MAVGGYFPAALTRLSIANQNSRRPPSSAALRSKGMQPRRCRSEGSP